MPIDTEPSDRKLAVILYADVAGYSRLTGEDEEGTHRSSSAELNIYVDNRISVLSHRL